jgi:hypothetical protein
MHPFVLVPICNVSARQLSHMLVIVFLIYVSSFIVSCSTITFHRLLDYIVTFCISTVVSQSIPSSACLTARIPDYLTFHIRMHHLCWTLSHHLYPFVIRLYVSIRVCTSLCPFLMHLYTSICLESSIRLCIAVAEISSHACDRAHGITVIRSVLADLTCRESAQGI